MFRLCLLLLAAATVRAAEPDWFPFPIDPLSSETTPAFDLSGLNEKPAGASGWLTARGEVFKDGKGRTVRLFGTNLTAEANFPEEKDASRLAKRLAQFGINVVRLHFLDNMWSPQDRSRSLIPPSNDPGKDGLNVEALARLDRLIAALRSEGIYINLNLHVGRTYPGYDKNLPDMHKGVDNYLRDMVDGLKLYTRLLLTHRNPHTGLEYKDDPAIAILEVCNEDSLVMNPWWISRAPREASLQLQANFAGWLRTKYSTNEALVAAWGRDDGLTGPEILTKAPLTKWIVERHQGSEHGIGPLRPEELVQDPNTVRWTAGKSGSVDWAIQLNSGPLMLEAGKKYAVTFEARSDDAMKLQLTASENGGAYRNLGLSETVELTRVWKPYSFSFTPGAVIPEGSRLVFSLLNKTGSVDLRGISLRNVSSGFLRPHESLKDSFMRLPEESSSLVVRRDFFEFLAETERNFASEMRSFLKDTLGCRQLISHSQVLFGGVLGARREAAVSDFVDTHGYWEHPSWEAGYNWTRDHWHIGNTSQIKSPDGGTLAEMAMQRPLGKPYSVSEYDIPAPSDYTAELWPMVSSMACYQGWSAIYHYTWAHSREDLRSTAMGNHFNACGHPAKLGFMPFGALVFRQGLVPQARARLDLHVGDDVLFDLAAELDGSLWGSWRELWKRREKRTGLLALKNQTSLFFPNLRRLPNELKPAEKQLLELHPAGGDSPPWRWDTANGVFLLSTPAAVIWCGALSGKKMDMGDFVCRFSDLPGPAPHATVTVVALDGQPLEKSKRALVTAMRRAENAGVKWNAARDSVDADWGHGPAGVVGLNAELTLSGEPWRIAPLDANGVVVEKGRRTGNTLKITPADATIWYLLER